MLRELRMPPPVSAAETCKMLPKGISPDRAVAELLRPAIQRFEAVHSKWIVVTIWKILQLFLCLLISGKMLNVWMFANDHLVLYYFGQLEDVYSDRSESSSLMFAMSLCVTLLGLEMLYLIYDSALKAHRNFLRARAHMALHPRVSQAKPWIEPDLVAGWQDEQREMCLNCLNDLNALLYIRD